MSCKRKRDFDTNLERINSVLGGKEREERDQATSTSHPTCPHKIRKISVLVKGDINTRRFAIWKQLFSDADNALHPTIEPDADIIVVSDSITAESFHKNLSNHLNESTSQPKILYAKWFVDSAELLKERKKMNAGCESVQSSLIENYDKYQVILTQDKSFPESSSLMPRNNTSKENGPSTFQGKLEKAVNFDGLTKCQESANNGGVKAHDVLNSYACVRSGPPAWHGSLTSSASETVGNKYITDLLEELQEMYEITAAAGDNSGVTGNNNAFRVLGYKRAIAALKRVPYRINKKNIGSSIKLDLHYSTH